MGVEPVPQNGWLTLFHGNPYVLMDDLGGKTTPIFGNSRLMDVEIMPDGLDVFSLDSGGTRVGGRRDCWR